MRGNEVGAAGKGDQGERAVACAWCRGGVCDEGQRDFSQTTVAIFLEVGGLEGWSGARAGLVCLMVASNLRQNEIRAPGESPREPSYHLRGMEPVPSHAGGLSAHACVC